MKLLKNFRDLSLSKRRKLTASISLPALAAVMIVGFQNCSPGMMETKGASVPDPNANPAPLDISQDTKPITIVYSENLLISMQQMAGVTTVPAAKITRFLSAKTKITETGKVDSVNAPMMSAIANTAADVCDELITRERALAAGDRRFLGLVDFTNIQGSAGITEAAKDDVIRRMARSFWGRNESSAERVLIKRMLDEAMAEGRPASFTATTAATDTANAMLFVCTSMMSSLDAIKM